VTVQDLSALSFARWKGGSHPEQDV